MDVPAEGRILLVGEGDFSFCVAMVNKLPESCHGNITATSLETDVSIQKHRDALQHIEILQKKGVTILLSTDATKLHVNPEFSQKTFSRIIFNFPHAGGKSNHKKNRKLLRDFFSSAVKVLDTQGQIFMTLCKGQGGTPADKPQRAWHDSWQVVSMAADAGLLLVKVLPFYIDEYTVYSSTGFRSQDKGFNTQNAITHIFEAAEKVEIPQDIRVPVILANRHYSCPRYVFNKLRSAKLVIDNPSHPFMQIYSQLVKELSSCTHVCDLGILKPLTSCSRDIDVSDPVDSPYIVCTNEYQEMTPSAALLDHIENLDDLVDTVYSSRNKVIENEKSLNKEHNAKEGCTDKTKICDDMSFVENTSIVSEIDNLSFVECNTVVSHRHLQLYCTQSEVKTNEDSRYCVKKLNEVLKMMADKVETSESMCVAAMPVVFVNFSSQIYWSPRKFIITVAKHFSNNFMNKHTGDEIVCNDKDDYVKAAVVMFSQSIVNLLKRMFTNETAFEVDAKAISKVCSCIEKNEEFILAIGTIKIIRNFCEDKHVKHDAKLRDRVIEAGTMYFILNVTDDIPTPSLVCSLDICELTCIKYGITDQRLVYSTDYRVSEQFEKLNHFCMKDASDELENQSMKYSTELVSDFTSIKDVNEGNESKAFHSSFSVHLSEETSIKPGLSQCKVTSRLSAIVAPSLYPLTWVHDMSFWESDTETFNELQYFNVIRDVALDNVINVDLIDSYTDTATGKKSRCYRLTFQSIDQVLSYGTSWKLQSKIRLEVEKAMGITLR